MPFFTLRRDSDQISPDIVRKLKAAKDAAPALQAAGLVIESLAKRAFRESAVRPAPWASLSPATIKDKARRRKSLAVLIRDAVLARSPRITSLSNRAVTIGTDRSYAVYHQAGKGRMYRPFFPFDTRGRLTPLGRDRVEAALRRKLGIS
ncbi:MAG TPA: phage virion morphogenesis protein [Chthoniobacterales bacterium]